MPETLEEQNLYSGPQVAEPLTYGALLSDASTPPELIPHLQRLAETETAFAVEQLKPLPPLPDQSPNVGKYRRDVVRLIDETPAAPGLRGLTADMKYRSRTMFEGQSANNGGSFFDPDLKSYEMLESGEYSDQELSSYIREARVLCDAFGDSAVRLNKPPHGGRYEGALAALTNVPLDKLRAVYQSGELSQDLRSMLASTQYEGDLAIATSLVQRIHGHEDILDMWSPESPALYDPTFHELLAKEDIVPVITSVLEKETTLWPRDADPKMVESAKREWGDRFLERVAGLPKNIRDDLQFETHSRTANPESGFVDSKKLRSMLTGTAYNVHSLGVDKIMKLHERIGTTNFDLYLAGQLRLLSDVLDGNQKAIEHLRTGDTTVVFMENRGDYNGALSQVPYGYATKNNRTLLFEIKQSGDIDRRMLSLLKLGIKSSTLVLASHGNAGVIGSGDTESGLRLVNNATDNTIKKSRFIDRLPGRRSGRQPSEQNVLRLSDMSRVVRDMMQDSRGIDDHKDAIGRRRIILNSCLSAKPVPVVHHIDKRVGGARKLLSRITGRVPQQRLEGEESIGATITEAAAHPNVEVFADENEFALQLSKDSSRLLHVEPSDRTPKGQRPRILPVTQYRLDDDGNLVFRRIDSIPLHRVSKNELSQLVKAA